MENASKALLITAGVILGVILLSVMIYLFRQGARVNQTYDQKQISLQLELYNSKFEAFDRDNNNIMDVISLCNLAFDVNNEIEFDKSTSVLVEVIIGNQKFVIPNTINKETQILERNQILKGSTTSTNSMSIYNLVNSTLKDLAVISVPQKTGIYSLADLPSEDLVTIYTDLENDKLSTTKLKSGKTIYKYLFGVSKYQPMRYHQANGKVSKITLIAYCNPRWND